MKNREIKFRAWGISPKMMISWNILSSKMSGEWWKHEDLILMQFTGLLDKNGKEIYEGDILSGIGSSMTKSSIEVIYNLDGFFGKDQDENITMYGIGLYKNMEIIGNIYQNPELLKSHEN